MALTRLKTLALTGLLALWATQAAAVLPDSDASVFEIPLPDAAILQSPDDVPGAVEAARQMTARYGGDWKVALWHPVSRTPLAMFGSGVQVADGALTTDQAAERSATSFLQANADLVGASASDLELEVVARGAGQVGVHYGQMYHGIPVIGGRVRAVFLEDGRLIHLGSTFYGEVAVNPVPALSAAVAEGIARANLPFNPATDKLLGETALMVLPVPEAGGGAEYHLVWRVQVGLSEPYAVYVTHVDAHSGEIIWRYNDVHSLYSGHVQGSVDQSGYCDGEQTVPLRNMNVTVTGAGTVITDINGDFSINATGGARAISAQFLGPRVNVNDTQYGDSMYNGTIQENVPLTINWTDASPSRRAERDCFFWVNATNEYVRAIDSGWSIPSHNANVNVNSTCNANWSTWTMNFFREGGGCANTGVIGDVMAHEFGHGIQYTLLNSQGNEGLGEGNGDIAASFMSDDSVIGRGFYLNNCTSGIRDCRNTLRYPGDVVGQQIHNAGRVMCGFNWDLRQLLEARDGAAQGKAYTADLWHFARKVYRPFFQPDQVLAYFQIDDSPTYGTGNGNLGDGTPNYEEICEAAMNHGFSCPAITEGVTIVHTPLGDTPNPGPFAVTATISAFGPNPLNTSSARLFYAVNGGAFTDVAMNNTGGSTFEGQIPSQPAGSAVAYYMTAETTVGVQGWAPPDAPEEYYLFGSGNFTVNLDDDIEIDRGWAMTEPGTDGTWERGDPVGTVAGSIPVQPEDDHTPAPGTICWVTGNPPPGSFFFVEEVDGRTSIVSPLMDMAGATMARGTVWLWGYFSVGNTEDYLELSASSDGGATWTRVVRVMDNGLNAWNEYEFTLDPFAFNFTSQMRFKVTAEDVGQDTIMDCAMDDFLVRSLVGGSAAVEGPASVRPVSYTLHPSQPNPFNPRTEIRYELPQDEAVKIAVYDVSGRELKVLVDEARTAGIHSVTWDGTDADGRALASGVYFYRLTAGQFEQTRRMTLIK